MVRTNGGSNEGRELLVLMVLGSDPRQKRHPSPMGSCIAGSAVCLVRVQLLPSAGNAQLLRTTTHTHRNTHTHTHTHKHSNASTPTHLLVAVHSTSSPQASASLEERLLLWPFCSTPLEHPHQHYGTSGHTAALWHWHCRRS